MFPKIVVPPNHEINHPFLGPTPIFGNSPYMVICPGSIVEAVWLVCLAVGLVSGIIRSTVTTITSAILIGYLAAVIFTQELRFRDSADSAGR